MVDDAANATGSRWTKRRKLVTAAIVAIILIVAGILLSSSDDEPDPGEQGTTRDDEVQTGDRPEPYVYVVEAEAEVGVRTVIENNDDIPHTVTSDDGLFDTGPIPAGDEARLPSLPPGTYTYHCEIHPILTGELVVTEG